VTSSFCGHDAGRAACACLVSGARLSQCHRPTRSWRPILLSADGDRMEKGDENDEMRSQTHPVVRGASACRPRSAVRRARLVSRPAAEWFEGGKGEEHGEEHRQLSPFCRVHACACVGVWPWLLTAMTVHASFGASDRTLFVSIGSDDW
jgi:hypothetical protein